MWHEGVLNMLLGRHRLKLIIITLAMGFGLGAQAQRYDGRSRTHATNSGSLTEKGSTFDYEDLLATLNQLSVKTISSLLEVLPLSFRSSFTLIHTSHSLHEASYMNPRVLMTNEDGTLIVSFNGRSDQRGYDALEIASVNKETRRIEFREISFSEDRNSVQHGRAVPNGIPLAPTEYEIRNPKYYVSKPNPGRCLSCHSAADPSSRLFSKLPNLSRYIWNSYDVWPGAYGSLDDYYFSENLIDPDELRRAVPQHSLTQEKMSLTRFASRVNENSRYKYLVFDKSNLYCKGQEVDVNAPCRRNLRFTTQIYVNTLRQAAEAYLTDIGPRQVYEELYQYFYCDEQTTKMKSEKSPLSWFFKARRSASAIRSGWSKWFSSTRGLIDPSFATGFDLKMSYETWFNRYTEGQFNGFDSGASIFSRSFDRPRLQFSPYKTNDFAITLLSAYLLNSKKNGLDSVKLNYTNYLSRVFYRHAQLKSEYERISDQSACVVLE